MADLVIRCGYGTKKIDMNPDEFFALPKDHILKKGYWRHVYIYTVDELKQIGGAVKQKYGAAHVVKVNGKEFELDSNVLKDTHSNIGNWFGKVVPIQGQLPAVAPLSGRKYSESYGMLDLTTGEIVAVASGSLTPITDSVYLASTDDMWVNTIKGRGNHTLHVVTGKYDVQRSSDGGIVVYADKGRGIVNLEHKAEAFTEQDLNKMLLEKQAEAKIAAVARELAEAGLSTEQISEIVSKATAHVQVSQNGKKF